MSILIKGLNMPKNCVSCMWHHRTCVCALTGMVTNTGKDCPLVEVPTPHGRLIDASTKIEAQLYDEMTEEWNLRTMTVDDYLAFAADVPPTIIEAEEGE